MKYELDINGVPCGVVPEKGEVIEITRKAESKEPLPPYNIVGNGFTSRHGTSVDLLEVCLQMNLSEMRLLQFFRTQFTNNIINKEVRPSVIEPTRCSTFDKYLATSLMKNYGHLEYLQIIKRVKRGVYILNPRVFIPSRHYLEMVAKWNSIGE